MKRVDIWFISLFIAPGVALHEQNLFSRNATIARNYTIAYKYSNVGIMGVIDFVQIDVLGAQVSMQLRMLSHFPPNFERIRFKGNALNFQNWKFFSKNSVENDPKMLELGKHFQSKEKEQFINSFLFHFNLFHFLHFCVFPKQTNASISFVGDTNVLQHRRVNATVRIQNATDFVSSVRIMGQPGFRFDDFWVSNNLFALYEQRLMKARSSALICTERIRDELRGKNRVFEFGNRGAADFLVYFQSGLGVANKLQRPEFTFDFQDTQVNITYLALTSSVSKMVLSFCCTSNLIANESISVSVGHCFTQ